MSILKPNMDTNKSNIAGKVVILCVLLTTAFCLPRVDTLLKESPNKLGATIDNSFEDILRKPSECTDQSCPSGAYFIEGGNGEELYAFGSLLGGPQSTMDHGMTDEYSKTRYAVLVGEGTYKMPGPFRLGYYTQVTGVADNRELVNISPGIDVLNNCGKSGDPNCVSPGGLDNFWRSISNLKLDISELGHPLFFGVSQASPIRDLTITGNSILMCDINQYGQCGYTSGGFISGMEIDANIELGSQQQFYVTQSKFQKLTAGAWNIVSNNNQGGYEGGGDSNVHNTWGEYPLTETTSEVHLKAPKLVLEENVWKVVTDKERMLVDDFIVLSLGSNESPTVVSEELIQQINEQLMDGAKGVIVEPGIYHLEGTLIVPDNKVFVGLGLPTFVCQSTSGRCMETGSEGVHIQGMTFDAGVNGKYSDKSNILLTVGDHGNGVSDNPSMLQDVYCRATRSDSKQATPQAFACIEVKADHTIGENLWLWRGDHDIQSPLIPYDVNVCEHGLIVRGDNVKMFGLFVEHFNNYQTVWYGKNGEIRFYQSEMPYFLTVDGEQHIVDCSHPDSSETVEEQVCASLYVSESATGFRGEGLGIYSFFPNTLNQKTIRAKTAIVVENDDVSFHHALTYWLNGDHDSGIDSILMNKNGESYPSESSIYQDLKGYAFSSYPPEESLNSSD
ncbi:unnamed protein product [Moneuplotes crassus]|uniref:Uncharacterized protein n=1 Tax=Euplotes crassus TaxID=5936 RepID=A0AAD1U149_EUPCR|nr:unnamed protein product [Moneuplotes crassus]